MKIIIYPIKQNHLHTYLYFEKGRDIYLNKNKKQKRKKKKTKKKKEKNKKEKRKQTLFLYKLIQKMHYRNILQQINKHQPT